MRKPLFLLTAFCLLFLEAAAQTIPFVLPWDDSAPSVTDFSALNHPIGTNRVSIDTNGHFTVSGERLRFLGVNFAGDSPFMPTNKADAVAARLAKFGVNSVRFHHMDAPWAYNGGILAYTSSSSTNFNPAQLERLHFNVSRLKAHGIYSDINLLVGREFRPGDGLGQEVMGMDWKDAHILGFFYGPALALQKDYATKLLGPTNRFTGLPLAKDPAVAFVEIINENGIIQKWLDGGLDRLPARYLTVLQSRWNSWLASRYTNDTSLLTAWKVIDEPLGPNLLLNGSFSNSLTSWNKEQHELAKATFSRTFEFTNGAPCARIAVTTPDATSWHIQFNQANLKLTSNQVYTISFWAKSSPATNADASVMRAHDDYSGLGYSQSLNLTTNWQLFTGTFQASSSDANARINFGGMGNKAATFWYADARLQSGGKIGILPGGASLSARTVPPIAHSGAGFSGTREARRDWLEFLRDLEFGYYQEMVTHLRTNLGYGGLIFGTILANSPATVQASMDVIDAHAYWQHPQFPGQPWDSVNWFVPNVSLVNTLADDNTLQGLASQRIKGKPFTVTEYQHPSPNYYGAEGPLLLAAYAGLQDWDGLWLFDYGQGNDTVTMGYVRGFFDLAQHPTKMANLLLAANLFRRQDIAPAAQEVAVQMNAARELETVQNAGAWSIFSSRQLGLSGKFAMVNRIATELRSDSQTTSPPPTPVGSLLTSDTGELRWDLSQAGKGLLTADTPRTKLLVGFADNRAVNLSGISLQPEATKLGWCTLGLTLTRGRTFTNDCTALLVATGWWENTGQIWTGEDKTSLGNKWGQPPVLAEVVPFTVTLPVPTNHVKVWSLDTRGQRLQALPVRGDASSTTISVTTNSGSLWYEVEIAPWLAGSDSWRSQYFSLSELADPAVSGDSATPDGDRIPNLLKYYLGLPGHRAADASDLFRTTLTNLTGQLFLELAFRRDKQAQDVFAVAEVSDDLLQWFSGASLTLEQSADLGEFEEVRIRDLVPIPSKGRHFLRLRLQRRSRPS